jgi:hypothetical protein
VRVQHDNPVFLRHQQIREANGAVPLAGDRDHATMAAARTAFVTMRR